MHERKVVRKVILGILLASCLVSSLYANGVAEDTDYPGIKEALKPGKGVYTVTKNDNTSCFRGMTSGENANWYVVKYQTSTDVKIDELTVKYTYRSENYPGVDWWGFAITNLTWTRWHAYSGEFLNETERFFHVQFNHFNVNYTYDSLDSLNKNHTSVAHWGDFGNLPGIWYLILFCGPSAKSSIEVYFNITGDVEFLSTSEGDTTRVLLPHDFMGNFNVKIGTKIVSVLNGEKKIQVDHVFLCAHYSFSGWGFEHLRYTNSFGESESLDRYFWKNHRYRIPYTPECIISEAKTWEFTLDTLLWGGIFNDKYWIPAYGISLLYADIQLPP
jgi:hypothetical protein